MGCVRLVCTCDREAGLKALFLGTLDSGLHWDAIPEAGVTKCDSCLGWGRSALRERTLGQEVTGSCEFPYQQATSHNPLLRVSVVAGVGFGHPIASRQARFVVDVAGAGAALQRCWAVGRGSDK